MDHGLLGSSATALTVTCVGIALTTDLRRRRIPNWLTFPSVVVGLGLWTAFLGWKGLAMSGGGMLAAPLVLVLLHLGRGPGMGDIKLAASVGALLGHRLSPVAMLLAAIAGGLLAMCLELRAGRRVGNPVAAFLVGGPGLGRWAGAADPNPAPPIAPATVPYAVGIALGTAVALAVYWCTEDQHWLF